MLKVTPSHLFIPDMAVTSVFGCVGLMKSWTKIGMVQKTLQFLHPSALLGARAAEFLSSAVVVNASGTCCRMRAEALE